MNDTVKVLLALIVGGFVGWLVVSQTPTKEEASPATPIAANVDTESEPLPEPEPEPSYTDTIIDRETTKSGTIKRMKWHLEEDGEPCMASEVVLETTIEGDLVRSEIRESSWTRVSVSEYSVMKALRTLDAPRNMEVGWCNTGGRVTRFVVITRPTRNIWQTTVYDREWQ